MTNFVIWNQTPRRVELHGPAGVMKLSPLQRRRLGADPRALYGPAALAARSDQVVGWEPEPTRSSILRVASLLAATGMVGAPVTAAALIEGKVVLGVAAGCLAAAALGGAAWAIGRGQKTLLAAEQYDPGSEPVEPSSGVFELVRDLATFSLQYSAFIMLVVVGVSAPAAALYFGTDLSDVVLFTNGHAHLVGGAEAHHVLVVRTLQLVLVILVSLVPALMYYQFDREKLSTLVDRWLHVIFHLDPTLLTIADVDAKYGRRVEEFLGATLRVETGPKSRRVRDRSPVVICTLLIATGWIIVMLSVPAASPGGRALTVPAMFQPLLTPVTMAFVGAYFLSVQVALRGFLRGDLKPKTYNVITVRILMAVVLAWAIQSLAGDGPEVLALAFLGGIVPNTVLLMIRSVAGRKATADDELDRRAPLTQIDEIDVYERTRLEEEGITSVQALARHDLIDLMLSTRIPAPRLIDWVDQAMLQQHTSTEVTLLLRANGVRTATDLLQVCADRDGLVDLTSALGDTCSPRLLQVVLAHDQWLDYVCHWRDNQDVHSSKMLRYGSPAPDAGQAPAIIDLRPASTTVIPEQGKALGTGSVTHVGG